MNTSLIKNVLMVSALLMPVASFAADTDTERHSAKAFVKDSVITSKIKALYAKDKGVSALHIKVDTDKDGVVQLKGKAKTQAEADKAVQIAQGVEGVTSVENKIKVTPDR